MARKPVGGSNVLRFPARRRECANLEVLDALAPSRSLVGTLIAERGEAPHDVQAAFTREFAYQAGALERGWGRDEAIIRLRLLVDAHVAHAIDICRAFQAAGDQLIDLEVRVAREERVPGRSRLALDTARAAFRNQAIAARAAADAAYGAAAALAIYIRQGLGDAQPVSASDSRQLVLFGRVAG